MILTLLFVSFVLLSFWVKRKYGVAAFIVSYFGFGILFLVFILGLPIG